MRTLLWKMETLWPAWRAGARLRCASQQVTGLKKERDGDELERWRWSSLLRRMDKKSPHAQDFGHLAWIHVHLDGWPWQVYLEPIFVVLFLTGSVSHKVAVCCIDC